LDKPDKLFHRKTRSLPYRVVSIKNNLGVKKFSVFMIKKKIIKISIGIRIYDKKVDNCSKHELKTVTSIFT
jgi:hypothetical protein